MMDKIEDHLVAPKQKRGIVLLSGGLDSCVVAALGKRYGWDLHALSVLYGQRHEVETTIAKLIARDLELPLTEISIPLKAISESSLLGTSPIATRTPEELRQDKKLNPACVPGRNTVLISLAVAYAEQHDLGRIFIGATAEDHAGFPDCRLAYFEAWSQLGTLALGRPLKVTAPFVLARKSEVVEIGVRLEAPLEKTISCYQPEELDWNGHRYLRHGHCGRCDACIVRRDAWATAGIPDPTTYKVDL